MASFLNKCGFINFKINDIMLPDPDTTLQYLEMFRLFILGAKKEAMKQYEDLIE